MDEGTRDCLTSIRRNERSLTIARSSTVQAFDEVQSGDKKVKFGPLVHSFVGGVDAPVSDAYIELSEEFPKAKVRPSSSCSSKTSGIGSYVFFTGRAYLPTRRRVVEELQQHRSSRE